MTILQSLDRYYGRMAARGDAEPPGFSREKISFAVLIDADGRVVDVADRRDGAGKKAQPTFMEVPAARKRTVAILSNRLWDKTSYALGRTAGAGRRTADEHAAFKALHRALLAGSDDPGLVALLRFVETWDPAAFDAAPFGPEMLDTNVVFGLADDQDARGRRRLIHQREAARALVARDEAGEGAGVLCLVTGERAPAQRLHPTIKGVEGAQTSGAALVSFNLDAFTSYGKEQGANAPVSEAAAFRYGAALNRMLDRASRNRVPRPIGDASVVFWADASQITAAPEAREEAARAAEEDFAGWLGASHDEARSAVATEDVGAWLGASTAGWSEDLAKGADRDAQEARKLADALDAVAKGRPQDVDPRLMPGVRFHVLGLAPNAARLSVRFWLDADFREFAKGLGQHQADTRIEPRPQGWKAAPSVARLLVKTTALAEKFDNIPDALAGETMRAILGGTPYPRTLLAAAIIRLRAGDDAGTGWHAAVIRAVLVRAERARREAAPETTKEELVSLDRTRPDDPAYHLGRLFAALETAQRLALGRVNATIRDRYFGAASATPASVFPLLLRGSQNHTAKLRKERKDGWIEREIGEIVDQIPPALPRSLKLEAQGRFAIGYYHQRQAQFAGRKDLAEQIKAADMTAEEGDDA